MCSAHGSRSVSLTACEALLAYRALPAEAKAALTADRGAQAALVRPIRVPATMAGGEAPRAALPFGEAASVAITPCAPAVVLFITFAAEELVAHRAGPIATGEAAFTEIVASVTEAEASRICPSARVRLLFEPPVHVAMHAREEIPARPRALSAHDRPGALVPWHSTRHGALCHIQHLRMALLQMRLLGGHRGSTGRHLLPPGGLLARDEGLLFSLQQATSAGRTGGPITAWPRMGRPTFLPLRPQQAELQHFLPVPRLRAKRTNFTVHSLVQISAAGLCVM